MLFLTTDTEDLSNRKSCLFLSQFFSDAVIVKEIILCYPDYQSRTISSTCVRSFFYKIKTIRKKIIN